MTCGPNRTCYQGCACHESAWAEKLAAAEARAEKAISDTVQEFGLRRAAEARVRALEEALTTIRLMCADGYYGPFAFTYAMEAKRIAALALAPPPEAEKKGGEKP